MRGGIGERRKGCREKIGAGLFEEESFFCSRERG